MRTAAGIPAGPRHGEGALLLAAYAACVPLANWMVGHVGTACPANGPCVVPTGFGLSAPSGVIATGLALVLRDLVQRRLGIVWSVGAMLLGVALSLLLAPRALALASMVAFLLSETLDMAVYTPLRRRGLVLAALSSGIAAAILDSLSFLYFAFGGLAFLGGQILGKAWVVLATMPALAWLQARDRRLGIMPR